MQYNIIADLPVCHVHPRGRRVHDHRRRLHGLDDAQHGDEHHGRGIGKMFSKAVSGESLFRNIWTARGNAMIAFGCSFPGRIMPIQITPGQSWILQKRAFLAAAIAPMVSSGN